MDPCQLGIRREPRSSAAIKSGLIALVTMSLPDDESYVEWIRPDDLDALFAHLDLTTSRR